MGWGAIARGLALLVGVVCLLLGLWESVVRLPGVMRVYCRVMFGF